MLRKDMQKGSVLIITLSIFLVIIGIGGALLWTSLSHAKTNRVFKALVSAQYAAQGGLNIATLALNLHDDIRRMEGRIGEWESVIYTEDGTAWVRISDDVAITGSGSSAADEIYNVRDVSLKARGDNHFRVVIDLTDPTAIDENGPIAYEVQSSASYDGQGYAVRGFINRNQSTQGLPSFTGYEDIIVTGNASGDSYNSNILTRDASGNIVLDDDGKTIPVAYGAFYFDELGVLKQNLNHEGDLGSNGPITVSGAGDTMVYGDAIPGPGQEGPDPDRVYPGCSTDPREEPISQPDELDISWLGTPATDTLVFVNPPGKAKPQVDLATGIYHYPSIDFGDIINITGDVTMYCHGDFKANSQGTLNIAAGGKLTLYCHGTFTYNGNFTSTNNNPADFTIKITRDDRGITVDPSSEPVDDGVGEAKDKAALTGYRTKINGNSTLYAVIDAPWSNVKVLGSCDFYGSIVGNRLLFTGSITNKDLPHKAKFHYDENLGEIQITTYDYFLHSSIRGAFQDVPVWYNYETRQTEPL